MTREPGAERYRPSSPKVCLRAYFVDLVSVVSASCGSEQRRRTRAGALVTAGRLSLRSRPVIEEMIVACERHPHVVLAESGA